MESPVTETADALAALMAEKLGIRRGEGLAGKLKAGGRLLPRRLRREATYIAEAAARAEVPRLAYQVDMARVARGERMLRVYLGAVDAADRRKGMILGILGWLAFNFLVISGLIIWYLAHTGRI